MFTKTMHIVLAAVYLVMAMGVALLGYQYVDIGYGLHPTLAAVISLILTLVASKFIFNVLDQMIEEQNFLNAQRDREIKFIIARHEKMKSSL